MNLSVNGRQREMPAGATVSDLLGQFDLGHERVAVECNGRILQQESFPEHKLVDGDVVEIVRFVGGG